MAVLLLPVPLRLVIFTLSPFIAPGVCTQSLVAGFLFCAYHAADCIAGNSLDPLAPKAGVLEYRSDRLPSEGMSLSNSSLLDSGNHEGEEAERCQSQGGWRTPTK